MKIAIMNEVVNGETRVAATPESVKRLLSKFKDIDVLVEKNAGAAAHYSDEAYVEAGAQIASKKELSAADVCLRVTPILDVKLHKKGSLIAGFMDPFGQAKMLEKAASAGLNVMSVERIPRTSRAQSMDALSSQANIGGYRAVVEAAAHLDRFFPVMMTAAGSSKPARVVVLGAGVAGLQAIATAKRLGARVEAFDVRPEVKEQIESLGGKFIELDVGEEAQSEGGYAKELSEEGKKKQQAALQDVLKKADIVISTAQIPGRPAPVLVTEDAVKGMKAGSVVIDMAAGGYNKAHGLVGGNCPLSKADEVVEAHGVTVVGHTNYPAMMASDASAFYARNLLNLLQLCLKEEAGKTVLKLDLEDDIIAASLVAHEGKVK